MKVKRNWLVRLDGRIEEQCEHEVGHTIFVPSREDRNVCSMEEGHWTHGCDGCCKNMKILTGCSREEIKEVFRRLLR